MKDLRASPEAMKVVIKRYYAQIKKRWYFSFPAMILPGIATILTWFIPPILLGKLVDQAISSSEVWTAETRRLLTLLVLSWLAGELISRIARLLEIYSTRASMESLHNQAIKELLSKDIAFFNDNFAGSLTKRAADYANRFDPVFVELSDRFLPFIITIVFSTIYLAQFSIWLAVLIFILIFVTVIYSRYVIRYRMKLVLQRNAARTKTTGMTADIITNISAVKTFGNEAYEKKRFGLQVTKTMDLAEKTWHVWNFKLASVISPLQVITNAAGITGALIVAGTNGLVASTVIVTFAFISRLTSTMWELAPVYQQLENNISEAAEHVEGMLRASEINDDLEPQPLIIKNGQVEFKDVTFKYSDGRDDVLSNFELNILAGQKIGLVGHSGSGKTTLSKLVMRLMDVSSGQILIDGTDISKVKQVDLRRKIAYVPQEPLMFHRSITDNIRYGKLSAKQDEIIDASKKAHAYEFIGKLTNGYETLVGERGVKLSGGQRQRIAIARAIIKDAPILVLDEATSALDSESEKLIQDALWKLMEGRTAIVIAHRLSTIQKMDKIIVLDDGKIVEQGSHQELLANKRKYYELWSHQSGGFIEE